MSSQSTCFWINNIKCLFSSTALLPNPAMTEVQKLNALTRLIIVVAIILLIVGWSNWWLFLLIGLVIIIILYYSSVSPTEVNIDHYQYRPNQHTYCRFDSPEMDIPKKSRTPRFKIKSRII